MSIDPKQPIPLNYQLKALIPHWLRRRPDQPEVRVIVSEGPWGQLVSAAPNDIHVNLVTVPLPSLHQTLTHAVADGQAA